MDKSTFNFVVVLFAISMFIDIVSSGTIERLPLAGSWISKLPQFAINGIQGITFFALLNEHPKFNGQNLLLLLIIGMILSALGIMLLQVVIW